MFGNTRKISAVQAAKTLRLINVIDQQAKAAQLHSGPSPEFVRAGRELGVEVKVALQKMSAEEFGNALGAAVAKAVDEGLISAADAETAISIAGRYTFFAKDKTDE